jgi:uncharacterized caspase-like protein
MGEGAILYNRAMKSAALALLLAIVALPSDAQAPRAQRLALVIGNGAYRDAPLPNPVNDAAEIAKALEASGFTVLKRENATLREMHLALREFGDRLGRQSTGLVYFAGHGLQVRGRNYLLPVDADIAREDEVAFAALDLGAVMEKLDSARNPVNIVILDACRNNPFGTRLQASAKGLAPVDAPPGTFIAFATAPGSTAADGTGRNGLYTEHLVRQILRPGLPIEEVFKAVRAGVRADSKSQQVPWESTSLETAFMFRAAPAPARVADAPKPPPAREGTSVKRTPASLGAPPAFAVGDTWTYRLVNQLDQSERRYVVRVTQVRGDEVGLQSGSITDDVGNFTRVVRGAERVDVYKPSTQFYVFPLKPGATWNLKTFQDSGEKKYDLKVTLKVGAEEEVATPMGPMRGLRIEREARWKQRGSDHAGVSRWTYWYNSAAKRFVAADESNTTEGGKVLVRQRHELVSYDVK